MPAVDRVSYGKGGRKDPLSPRVFRTQNPQKPEDLWQPLYDRVEYLAAGSAELGFFSQPLGATATLITGGVAAAKTKSYRDTNMQNSNVVPTKLFRFEGISLAYMHLTQNLATNLADREILRNGGYLRFRIVDKDIINIPMISLPELNPVTTAATTVTATTMLGMSGGGGRIAMYKLPIPIVLNPYESFQITLTFDGSPTITNALDIVLMLQGYMRRPT